MKNVSIMVRGKTLRQCRTTSVESEGAAIASYSQGPYLNTVSDSMQAEACIERNVD